MTYKRLIRIMEDDFYEADNLIQNMVDAGCSEKEVSCFCECYKRQDRGEELDIQEVHRA